MAYVGKRVFEGHGSAADTTKEIIMGFKQLAVQARELVSSQVAYTLCRLHEGPLGIKQMTHDRQ